VIVREYIILIVILFLALFLRGFDLRNNPPELFSDELINYVSAKSVIETGKDLHGRLMPYFTDRVELRPPIYGYSTYISSIFLGENTLAIRTPAVIYGIITIVAVYLLTLQFFEDKKAALTAAFFMAIIPWHIHYSRPGWEPASLLPFLLFSAYFFIYGVNTNRKYLVAISFGLFTLTIYTYQAAPLYSFLFLFSLFIMNYQYFLKEKKLFALCILISLALVSPYLWTISHEEMMYARAKAINTFSEGMNSESLSIFIHNYISHFKPSFLFISGDPNLRHGAGVGTIYWIMLPLIIVGLIQLFISYIPRQYKIFIILWILIFPLGGSLTNDGVPHATRTLPGAPLFCILCGLGFNSIYRFIKLKSQKDIFSYAFTITFIVISLVSLVKFSRNYYFEYPKKSYGNWEYGHKEIFSKIKSMQNDYERACLENLNYWNEIQLKDFYLKDIEIEITNDVTDPNCLNSGSIIVQWAGNRDKNKKFIFKDFITSPDGNKIYKIYTTE